MNQETTQPTLSPKDFRSDADPRWCPGCGDYAVLSALTKTFAQSGKNPHEIVVISGIGCSSRLPYYLSTYGFHTIHGRAPTVATGVSLTAPHLDLWMVTGDGDGLSIGLGHFLHMIRRNVNIKVLLFNNEIYGLTKGQASPTSPLGQVSSSTPQGLVGERAVQALPLAITQGASFVARVVDTQTASMSRVFKAAQQHKGTAIIEVLTNCIIYNDGAFKEFEDPKQRRDSTVELGVKQPLIFGKTSHRKLILDQGKILSVADSDPRPAWVYDPGTVDPYLAMQLSQQNWPEIPLAVGVLFQRSWPAFADQYADSRTAFADLDLDNTFRGPESWQVKH